MLLLAGVIYFLKNGNYRNYEWWQAFCLAVSLSGEALRIFTMGYVFRGTSGRNTKYQEADDLNTTGIYSVVRNPLYLANIIIYLGVLLVTQNWIFVAGVLLLLLVYYERIIYAEEAYLAGKFGERYAAWARNTPALIPNFGKYAPSGRKFDVKLVLRKEFSGIFAVVLIFFVINVLINYYTQGLLAAGFFWKIFLAAGLAFYVFVLYLKKRTDVLKD
jgi:protein-S-isoprenylcysteine O-methyltransferase Ste14